MTFQVNPTPVTENDVDYLSIYDKAVAGVPDAHPVYEFGGGRKTFDSRFQKDGIYEKPYPSAPDPDLVSTNP